MSRANALRAQAAALRAQADAIDMEADAIDMEQRPTSGPEWLPAKSCGIPSTTARRLVREQVIRGSRVGRELLVHAGDVAAYVAAQQVRPEIARVRPVSVHALDPYERALRKRAS